MIITNEIAAKFERAKTLYDKINVMFRELHESDIIYENQPEAVNVVDDTALIQCFYGVDIARIRATTTAIEFNLQMTSKPHSWVFVECQKSEMDCAFSWVQKYGIKYQFVKMGEENEGIFLKNCLWNIGTTLCSEPKLCFVDSDVVMCDSSWARKASEGFNQYDVMSLASHQYYQYSKDLHLGESIGFHWISKRSTASHCGFTFGITREAFERIGKFDVCTTVLDDVNTYYRILGRRYGLPFKHWVGYVSLDSEHEFGYDLKLGYIDNIVCHVWHGESNRKYKDMTNLLKIANVNNYSEILDCHSRTELPKWKPIAKSAAMKRTILNYYASSDFFNLELEYYSQMRRICGVPDSDHPLYVCTVVKSGFGVDLGEFVKFRDSMEMRFKTKPVVVFFTDSKLDFESEGLNVVELKEYDSQNEFNQCLRDDVKFPSGAVVYYVPFGLEKVNNIIWRPEETTRFNDGTVLLSVN